MNLPEKLKILIITLSDRASRGDYADLSGPKVTAMVSEFLISNNLKFSIERALIPDEADTLSELIKKSVEFYDIIFTTGGTGIGPRDITTETVKPLLTKEIPGIMEFIRVKYGAEKPNALLSRGVAGIMGKSLIYTLPGSVKAVEEYMTEILKTVTHTLYMVYGIDRH